MRITNLGPDNLVAVSKSISPKFSNSVPVVGAITPAGKVVDERMVKIHNRKRQNTEAIKQMMAFHTDYHYKPVWDGTEENLKEIEDYRVELGIPKDKTYIMPAGDEREQLIKMYPLVFELCAERSNPALTPGAKSPIIVKRPKVFVMSLE